MPTVRFFDFPEMLDELKKKKVKEVRIQTIQIKEPLNIGFVTYATARVNDEVWKYVSDSVLTMDGDKRRIKRARKTADEIDLGMTKIAEDKGFEVGRGRYE